MTAQDTFRDRWSRRQTPALISVHRGLWGEAPENSIAAIQAGADLGIVEIDVQIAGDGVPVVFHDPDLCRMAGRPERIAATPSADLAGTPLRPGAGGDGRAPGPHSLPLLSDVLAAAPAGIYFDYDAKNPGEVDQIGAALRDLGGAARGSLKIDTETGADIDRLLAMEARYGTMVMAKVVLPRAGTGHIRDLTEAGVAAAEIWFDDLDQVAEAAAIAGDRLALTTYTLDPVHCCGLSDARALEDPDAVWGRLLEAGITVIMTDQAQALATYMAGR